MLLRNKSINQSKQILQNNIFLPYGLYGEIAPVGEWLTGIVWCCPKKVYTIGLLEDTVMIQCNGFFLFSRDHGL